MLATSIYCPPEFVDMDSAYWGLGSYQDEIYIGLCSHNPQKSATIFSFDRKTKKMSKIASLDEVLPSNRDEVPQGKIHTPFLQGQDNKLYFATHFAYPFGEPQAILFEGGHLLSYDPVTRNIADLGIPIKSEGIQTLTLDPENMILYGVSGPSFEFFSYDIYNKKYRRYGQITDQGSICRSLVVDDQHHVYGSYEENKIFRFNRDTQAIEHLEATLPSVSKNVPEWHGKYRGGVNFLGRKIWRSAVWHPETRAIFGIHAATSELFRFHPESGRVEKVAFMGNRGDEEQLHKIYPTLSLCSHQDRLYYVPVSGFFDYTRSEHITDLPSLVSYNVATNTQVHHGKLQSEDRSVLGVAASTVTKDGTLYFLGAVDVLPNEQLNTFNVYKGKHFHIGLIEVTVKETP